jgi:hypothetical protein
MTEEYASEELQEALEKSGRWLNRLSDLIDGLSFTTDFKNRVSASLFHLSIDHHGGVHTLVKSKLYGPAIALLRPQFETYLRGAWYNHCATEEQVDAFIHGAEPPRVNQQIADLVTKEGYKDSPLRELKDVVWNDFCDFTHGGIKQVGSRITDTEITQSYDLSDIARLLNSSAILSQLACVGMAEAIGSMELPRKAYEAYKNIYGGSKDALID